MHQVDLIFRPVLVVHYDERAILAGGEEREGGRAGEPPDVVDDRRAGRDRRLRDLELVGVDRHGHRRLARQARHDSFGSCHLLARADRLVPGSCRLAADVEHVGPLAHHAQPLRDRLVVIRAQTVAAEGVGGGVDDPHDIRA